MASQFDSLNGLRGAAATWIAIGHTIWALQQVFTLPHSAEYALKLSWTAVEVFFVLSGFVMAHAYPDGAQTRSSYVSFMVKRFARIYPLYILCVFLYMILVGAHEWGHSPRILDYAKHIFLLQTWWNYSHPVWLDPAWSLSAEWGSYVLFPLCFKFMRLRTRRDVIEWLIVLVLCFIVFHMEFAQNNLRMIVHCGVIRAAPCFAIGILLCRLKQLTPAIPRYSCDFAAAAFLLITIGLYFTHGSGFLLLPASVLLIYTSAYETGFTTKT